MVARLFAPGRFEAMRYLSALTALFAFAALSPALAQMYPGQDVTMNPSAAGTQVLLYPGGKYKRVVHQLRMPGDTNDGQIHLHMPTHHRLARHNTPRPARVAAAAPTETAPLAAAPAIATPAVTTPPIHMRPAKKISAPPPAAPPAQNAGAASMSELEDLAAVESAKPAPVKPERKPPPQRVAKVEQPPPARPAPVRNPEPTFSGAKKNVILFAVGASDPAASAVQNVKTLAGDLSAALSDGSARVQLVAYGGQRGDKSSDTRRLSLKRALIIRQLLIDDGVPSERIDVHAMGGVDDSGPPDRVDVFLQS